MKALRTTRLTVPLSRSAAAWACGFLAAFGLFGCGTASPPAGDGAPAATVSPGGDDPVWLTSRGSLPAPDPDRVEYDSRTRLLSFHDLPAGDRWMVQLPDETDARLVGPLHRLPEGVDTSRTLVYYARPGAKVSSPISVAQIEAGRAPHSSQARNP